MRRLLICLATLCTAVAGSWLFVRFYPRLTGAAVASAPDASHQVQWAYPNEQIWIVDEIAEAIVNMAGTAGESRPARGSAVVTSLPDNGAIATFAVTLDPGKEVQVAIDRHIWAPEVYAPIAAAAFGQIVAVAGDSIEPVEHAPIILTLTNPRPTVIQRENERVSALLRANPGAARAHDEAALVLSALALRESAGPFSDPRRIMSRMTAHLAVARHLGGAAPAAPGRVAEAVLLTLVGRQRDAIDRLRALEQLEEPGVRAWSRALRLRNTNDWRRTRWADGLTFLEQRETLRAIDATLGGDRAVEFFTALGKPTTPTDWSRALVQWGGSVEAGKVAEDALVGELAEASEVRKAFGVADDLPRDALLRELSVESGLGPVSGSAADSLWVVDWGMWAASSQRHLVMRAQAATRHLREGLGLPKDAQRFAQDVEKALSPLTLFALVRPYLASDRETYDGAHTAARDVCRRRPELVTELAWRRLLQKPAFASVPDGTPPSGPWFMPLIPAGTAFEAESRAFGPSSERRVSVEEIDRWRALSPYRRQLVIEAVRQRHGNTPEFALLQREYGDVSAYDLILARRVARAAAGAPDAYVPLMRKVGELNPESLAELAAYLLDRGKADEARGVYEEWARRARDRVEVSNSAWWLVRHYHETGQRGRAEALARRAADAQSYRGLVTLADLHDWRGETPEAKAAYETAAKRHHNDSERLAFYLRRVGRHPELKAAADSLTPQIFPGGLERVGLRDMRAAPTDGVSLLEVGASGVRNGLRKNDVVVGVDGIRVRNLTQYRVARAAGDAPDLTFLVWRDIGYLEVKGPFRYGWPINTVRAYQKVQ